MTIAELARDAGVPYTTARDAAIRIGIAAGQDLVPEEWEMILDEMNGMSTKRRAVWQMDTDGNDLRRFGSARRAAMVVGGHATSIIQCCKGNQRTAAGFCWRYAE